MKFGLPFAVASQHKSTNINGNEHMKFECVRDHIDMPFCRMTERMNGGGSGSNTTD